MTEKMKMLLKVKQIGIFWLAKKTKKIRHFFMLNLMRFLTPTFYRYARPLPRPMIDFIKNKTPKKKSLVGVEIGVLCGENTENILKTLPIKKLYLVDPYLPYAEDDKLALAHPLESAFEVAKKRLSKFNRKIVFIKKKSSEAVNDIPNNLDFVYIDGNHAYEFVKKDIELYYPKIKKCGVIGGHDFCIDFSDVCKVVLEFAEKNNLKIYGEQRDWWLICKSQRQKTHDRT